MKLRIHFEEVKEGRPIYLVATNRIDRQGEEAFELGKKGDIRVR